MRTTDVPQYDPAWRPTGEWTQEERLRMIQQMDQWFRGPGGLGSMTMLEYQLFFINVGEISRMSPEGLRVRMTQWSVDYFGTRVPISSPFSARVDIGG